MNAWITRVGVTRLAWIGLSAAALAPLAGCQGPRQRRPTGFGATPVRAVWVTRWDYETAGDITHVMDNCSRAGFNTVLFQVRGAGTAFYRSRLEPWADELGGRDPGYDPLAVACRSAHERGMELHAWVNVMPGYRGKHPPINPRQLYVARPDWFWHDKYGRRQPLGWYSSINPCYPEVRRYLTDVMREIVVGYPVDGLHLDYIRFPNERSPAYPDGTVVPDYPRDPRTLALFRRDTGTTPDTDPAAWNAWRTRQVTRLVKDIREMVSRERPNATLSAAVAANMIKAKDHHFQDAPRWLRDGIVDAVFPMNYADSMRLFESQARAWRVAASPRPMITGIMFDKRDPATVLAQIELARRIGGHYAAFAYNSIFERRDDSGRRLRDAQSNSRAALRREVLPRMLRLTGAP